MPGTATGTQTADVGETQPPTMLPSAQVVIPVSYVLTGTGLSLDGDGNLVIQPGFWTISINGMATVSIYDVGNVKFQLGAQSNFTGKPLYLSPVTEILVDDIPLTKPVSGTSGQITAGQVTTVSPIVLRVNNPYGDTDGSGWSVTGVTVDFTWTAA